MSSTRVGRGEKYLDQLRMQVAKSARRLRKLSKWGLTRLTLLRYRTHTAHLRATDSVDVV